jgi:multidrug resistance efflux pump
VEIFRFAQNDDIELYKETLMFNSKKIFALVALALVAMFASTLIACAPEKPAIAQTAPTPMPTPTNTPAPAPTKLASRAAPTGIKATGNLVAATQATMAFPAAGRVKEIAVKEGDAVKKGALLIALDPSVLDFAVAQAQAGYDTAKASYDRVMAGPTQDEIAIAKSNLERAKAAVDQAQAAYDRIGGVTNPFISMTPQSLALQQATQTYQGALAQFNLTVNHPTTAERQTVEAQLALAKAALDLAKQNAANAKIFAPFDGTITWIGPRANESLAANAAAIMLADLSQMQVLVNVDEITLSGIRLGQKATITLDALADKTLTGKVRKIGLLATSTGNVASVPVTLDIDATDAVIYPGLTATVEFH